MSNFIESKSINQIQFGILSPDEIKKISVCLIEHPESYDIQTGKWKKGGLSDPRMGTISNYYCETCKMENCSGHFGHIDLAVPLFHSGFIDLIVDILHCICFHCSSLLFDKKQHLEILSQRNPKLRFKSFRKICGKTLVCEFKTTEDKSEITSENALPSGCGGSQPVFQREGISLVAKFSNKDQNRKEELSAEKVLTILQKVNNEDWEILGFDTQWTKPDWMILTRLPVPPPSVRPPVSMDTNRIIENEITLQLKKIVKYNNYLRMQKEQEIPEKLIREFSSMLQFYVSSYLGSEKVENSLRSIASRLNGKDGRIRGNLLSKRVDFSARSIVSGDPNLRLDEVGVPISIAMKLTFPEVVNSLNIDKLKELVNNGPFQYPGANYIIREDGRKIDLRTNQKPDDKLLSYGYKVERHLQNGDYVVLSKKPALHKLSVMGHQVKVMPFSTFRLNLSVTTPYNAGFDGTEMNMYVPQSLESVAEISELMMVSKQLLSAQSCKPVMGIVQDALLGCRLFTKRNVFLEKEMVMNLVMWIQKFQGKLPIPALLKPKELWTGKQIFSLILPPIDLIRNSNGSTGNFESDSASDTNVVIQSGDLISGILDKRTLGWIQEGLIHVTAMDLGREVACEFINQCQSLMNYWISCVGFSLGISDLVIPSTTQDFIDQRINSAKGDLKSSLKNRDVMNFEELMNWNMNRARDSLLHRVMEDFPNSSLYEMILSGSRGSNINILQMLACVGQQNVEGKIIQLGFKTNRTLPHFHQFDFGSKSRGFIENSFLRGLKPHEFFFHAMAGREGILNSAMKARDIGFIQRSLVKAMEDLVVQYDYSVRDANGEIIQFLYGEDGIDATAVESQKIDSLSDRKFEETYKLNLEKPFEENVVFPEIIEDIKSNYNNALLLNQEFEKLVEDKKQLSFSSYQPDSFYLPVHLKRLIGKVQKLFKIDQRSLSDMRPSEVIKGLQKLQEKLQISNESHLLFLALLRSTFASKKVIGDYRLSKVSFDWLMKEIESRYLESIVHPGEAVGTLAAQSLGEPSSQMIFVFSMFAGVSRRKVCIGIPRLKELLGVVEDISLPTNKVFLKKEYKRDTDKVREVALKIECTTLESLLQKSEIYYDPLKLPHYTSIIEDRDLVSVYFEFEDTSIQQLSPYLLRFEFCKEKIANKNIQLEEIEEKIASSNKNLHIIRSDQNAEQLVFLIRINDQDSNSILSEMESMQELEKNLLKEVIKGIKGINSVYLREEMHGIEREWILDCYGTGLMELLTTPEIDNTQTFSNNIIEISKVLGIEAAREVLYREIKNLLAWDGSYVNSRHVGLIADVMTHTGKLRAITKPGVISDQSPLKRSSYADAAEVLSTAAAFAENDRVVGVTEKIAMGSLASIGTGAFHLILDERKSLL